MSRWDWLYYIFVGAVCGVVFMGAVWFVSESEPKPVIDTTDLTWHVPHTHGPSEPEIRCTWTCDMLTKEVSE